MTFRLHLLSVLHDRVFLFSFPSHIALHRIALSLLHTFDGFLVIIHLPHITLQALLRQRERTGSSHA